ncbi:MAG: hypothetical protein CSA76_05430 [Spirochaetales bacterium]|nr:MAG: hypothetical protein CSA76_05430 [Spirochaetales bacterium]
MSETAKKSSRSSSAASSGKKPGKKIGKYQNAVLVAKGGMGAIYKADHPTLEQPVVLKMLTLTDNEQFAQRFQREATIMMGFQHVNIVNYFDHFKTTRSYCMVMEYVDGCSLAQLLEKHRYLDDDVALLVIRDTLRALSFAHAKGVIHRDIKPANILISSTGEVKLTDFGIAQNQAVDSDSLTREGMTLGTPSYMAPEQFRDAGAVDERADVYSTGVLLYECLTGVKPFAGASLPEMLERIRKGRYERLRKVRPESLGLSRRLVRRAMRPRPEMRYQDAARMLRPLERFLSHQNESSLRLTLADLVNSRGKVDRPGGNTRRKILKAVMLSAAAAAGVCVLGAAWWLLALGGRLPAFLMPGFLGAVRADVQIVGPVENNPRVLLDVYRQDNEGNSVKVGSREGRLAGNGKQNEGVPLVRTFPRGVKPGYYTCVVHVGNRLYNHFVQIPSLRARSQALEMGENPQVVLREDWEPIHRKVRVSWRLVRGDTGAELAPVAPPKVVDENGRRISGVRYGSGDLMTGSSYRLFFSLPGFASRSLDVSLDAGVSDCFIEVNLMPEKAVLELASDLPFRRPSIQGEKFYRYAGDRGGFRPVPFLRKKPVELELSPGTYTVVIGAMEKQASRKVVLKPGGRASLRLVKDEEGNTDWVSGR